MFAEPSCNEYRDLLAKVNDVIWKMDLNMNITYVSPACERLIGYTQQERLSQSVESQMTPDSYQRAITFFTNELTRDKEPGVDPNRTGTIELEYYHKDGGIRWFENVVSWDRAEDGTIIGIQGISRDITERRLANEAILKSEERYRTLAEESPISIMTFDKEGKLLLSTIGT
ncbi:MAG: PAS domain S-box protein [Pseudomonadota bacterium]